MCVFINFLYRRFSNLKKVSREIIRKLTKIQIVRKGTIPCSIQDRCLDQRMGQKLKTVAVKMVQSKTKAITLKELVSELKSTWDPI